MASGYTPTTRPRVLVVGARERSLGSAVAVAARASGYDVYTAGLSGEAIALDPLIDNHDALVRKLAGLQPQFVVSTIGLNAPKPRIPDAGDWYRWHFETNVTANMLLLQAYQEVIDQAPSPPGAAKMYRHFVAISSNSARIPRTQSAAYCASKAALSMALRVEAREGARRGSPVLVYGYEPGLLRDTPMTVASQGSFVGALHRMVGVRDEGLDPAELAEFVVANFRGSEGLNGLLLPYDADEL